MSDERHHFESRPDNQLICRHCGYRYPGHLEEIEEFAAWERAQEERRRPRREAQGVQ